MGLLISYTIYIRKSPCLINADKITRLIHCSRAQEGCRSEINNSL